MQKIKLICENALWRESFLSYVRASGARMYFSCRDGAAYDGVLIFGQEMERDQISQCLEKFNLPTFIVRDNQTMGAASFPVIFLPIDTSLRHIVSAISLFFADEDAKEQRAVELKDEEAIISSFLKKGMPNKEISLRSDIPISSVKYYLRSLYKKLEVTNRHQAISKLQELDL